DRQVVHVGLGLAQRRGLGVVLLLLGADVGALEDVQPLRIGAHHPVLDPVVDHLHEVPGTGRAAVQVALLGGRRLALAAGRALRGVDAGGQRAEERVQALDRLVVAADHQAVAAVEAEDAAAGAHVDVVQPLLAELGGAAQVVAVVGVAAVDDGVVGLQQRGQLRDGVVDEGRRDHDADAARRLQRLHEPLEGRLARRALPGQLGDRVRADVVDDAVVASTHEPAHHVGAHAAQSDHPNLHGAAPYPVGCVATLAPGRWRAEAVLVSGGAGPSIGRVSHPDRAVRASDAEREDVSRQLSAHAAAGRLTPQELDERLDAAYAARTHGELMRLLEDLPPAPVPRAEDPARAWRALGWRTAPGRRRSP